MQRILLMLALLGVITSQKPVTTVTGTVFDNRGNRIHGVTITEKRTKNGTVTDVDGHYSITVFDEWSVLEFAFIGYVTKEEKVGTRIKINVVLEEDLQSLDEVVVIGYGTQSKHSLVGAVSRSQSKMSATGAVSRCVAPSYESTTIEYVGEDYADIEENKFYAPMEKALSTFSIDVDAASYSNMRRFLNSGQKPPADAVRIEEMINYFTYDYPQPEGENPFSITTNYLPAPWNEQHQLVQIGLQGKKIATENLPASNLVFLLDVSGSMSDANKLPLLKASLKMLVNEMREIDKISIVVYAGAAGIVLPPTSGTNKSKIIDALENLQAGGSTAGGAGIQLAYKIAKEHFVEGGNNRVIMATDGDFNVGLSSDKAMEQLIEEKRDQGVFLTVLGFGMGNYKDSKMELLADKGNGNYAYIDNMQEAKKVLVTEFGGTLFTIAKDVKIQVEFNPAYVQAYRLIGYENRKLNDEDFNDDKKDAGELGSGHTVTALYEIIPVGVKSSFIKSVDALKYQKKLDAVIEPALVNTNEILTVKFRYKEPQGTNSKLITKILEKNDAVSADANIQWAASVAAFGMLLRDSEFKGDLNYERVVSMAKASKGADEFGYRSEFIQLVRLASNTIQ
jgi:Ca-activated chloride channel homolog